MDIINWFFHVAGADLRTATETVRKMYKGKWTTLKPECFGGQGRISYDCWWVLVDDCKVVRRHDGNHYVNSVSLILTYQEFVLSDHATGTFGRHRYASHAPANSVIDHQMPVVERDESMLAIISLLPEAKDG